MSKDFSPSSIPAKRDETGSTLSRMHPADKRALQLRGVIRVLINKNQRLQQPVTAAKKLAKHYQALKEENERMKQVSYNYKTGMERAERRSAYLQQDLARRSKAGGAELSTKSSSGKENPVGLQFYLPASAKQMIDGLAADNVALMKSLVKMSGYEGKIDQVFQKNLEMESLIKSLREEVALKSSLLEDYEAEMSTKQPKSDSEKLAESIILQRRECAELKTKIKSYQKYAEDLREKNTIFLDTIMTKLDKSNRGPTESADEEEENGVVSRDAASAPYSSAVSGRSNGGARKGDSLNSEHEFCSIGIQTDSGFCTSSEQGSVDDVDMISSSNENGAYEREIKELKHMVAHLTGMLEQKEEEDKRAKRQWSDMEHKWMERETELEKLRKKSVECAKKIKNLEEEKVESEAIMQLMQERVDQVNAATADSANREEKLRDCEKELGELQERVPMMEQALKVYEEDIKAYGVEREQLLEGKRRLESEVKALRELRTERQLSQHTSAERQQGWPQQGFTQEIPYDRTGIFKRYQADMRAMSSPVQEPFMDANAEWASHTPQLRGQLVADGGHRFDSPPEDVIRGKQRQRRLPQADSPEDCDSDTVKCENCNERYPRSLIQDHFRDCLRNQNN